MNSIPSAAWIAPAPHNNKPPKPNPAAAQAMTTAASTL